MCKRSAKQDPTDDAATMVRAILGAVERREIEAVSAHEVALVRRLQELTLH
jgi:hypothetical protein